MEVILTGVSAAATVVHLEKTSHLSALAEGRQSKWLRICDYLIIDDQGLAYDATLIELKKSLTMGNRDQGFEQLRRSLPILEYLLSVCAVECGRSWQRKVKYVLIAEKYADRFDQRRTRPQPPDSHKELHEGVEVSVLVGAKFQMTDIT